MPHTPEIDDHAGGSAVTKGAPSRPHVRLIVLNYNGGDNVVRCLDALSELDWPADRLELVVIDNVSQDGSADVVEQRFPHVRLIRNPRNTGFPANNLALRDLDGVDYAGLVNPDAFVEPGWLAPLVDALEDDPALGAACGRMLLADRFVGVEIDSPTFVPGATDRRTLGVRISGLEVGGKDRWADAHVAEGGWGTEHDRHGGTFEWTTDRAVLHVPVPVGAMPESDPGPESGAEVVEDVTARIRLAAEAPKEVTLVTAPAGPAVVWAEVGPEPGWVEVPLTGAAAHDVVNNVGSVVLVDGYGADRGFLEPDDGQYDLPAEVFAWCGGNVLFRPAYLADVGLFDERFFLYYEDTDLSWRGRSRGWRYRYVPDAVVRHVHSASTGEGSALFQHYVERNRLLMLVKNAPPRLALSAVWRYLLVTLSYGRRDLVRPLLSRRRPRLEQVRRRVGSLLGFARLLPAMLRSRRQVRSAATVVDEEIVAWLSRRREVGA